MRQRAEEWLAKDPDQKTKEELQALLAANNEEELKRRFSARLEFGTAGLRGVVGAGPARMNRLVVLETSEGLADYLKDVHSGSEIKVVVGYDGRLDSKQFAEDSAAIFAAKGLKVFLSDKIVATPICAFALKAFDAQCAVMVTASHNPPEYNGYKVYWDNGAQIIPPHDKNIAEAIDNAAKHDLPSFDFKSSLAENKIEYYGDDLIRHYTEDVLKLSTRPIEKTRESFGIAYTPLHGVGAPFAENILAKAGFKKVHTVLSQREPDGHFPTVRFPNPEEDGAMDAVIALAKEHQADLILANDPDADRLAVAYPDGSGRYKMLTGDQIGLLLGVDRIESIGADKSFVVNSLVSSRLLGVAAKALGADAEETLTGFKWIMNRALERQAKGERCLFGYEEALGYCVGDLVHDKDGLSAVLIFAELAHDLKTKGKTIADKLEDIYRKHGFYLTRQKSLALDPNRDPNQPTIGDQLRQAMPNMIAGRKVLSVSDLSVAKRFVGVKEEKLAFPKSDVLVFILSGEDKGDQGARVIVRPSGTEPKVKCYYEVIINVDENEDFSDAEKRAEHAMEEFLKAHQAELAALG